jgi:hypothetical protein
MKLVLEVRISLRFIRALIVPFRLAIALLMILGF